MTHRLTVLFALCGLLASAGAQPCVIEAAATAQAAYAKRRLESALGGQVSCRFTLGLDAKLGAEAFSIVARGRNVSVSGGDARGLIYGALAAREQLLNGVDITKLAAKASKPAEIFRGIKFNTPWDTYRPSSALDQHYNTVRDLEYWEAFLDMLVENRFNGLRSRTVL